jgi:hypothetical protein
MKIKDSYANSLLEFINKDDRILILGGKIGGKIGSKNSNDYYPEKAKKIYDIIEKINPTKIIDNKGLYIDHYYNFNILDKKKTPNIVVGSITEFSRKYQKDVDALQSKVDHRVKFDPYDNLINLIKKKVDIKTVLYEHDDSAMKAIQNNTNANEYVAEISKYKDYNIFREHFLSDNNCFFVLTRANGKYDPYITHENIINSKGNPTTGMSIIAALVNKNIKPYIIGYSLYMDKETSVFAHGHHSSHSLEEETDVRCNWHKQKKLVSLDLLAEYELKYKLEKK